MLGIYDKNGKISKTFQKMLPASQVSGHQPALNASFVSIYEFCE